MYIKKCFQIRVAFSACFDTKLQPVRERKKPQNFVELHLNTEPQTPQNPVIYSNFIP